MAKGRCGNKVIITIRRYSRANITTTFLLHTAKHYLIIIIHWFDPTTTDSSKNRNISRLKAKYKYGYTESWYSLMRNEILITSIWVPFIMSRFVLLKELICHNPFCPIIFELQFSIHINIYSKIMSRADFYIPRHLSYICIQHILRRKKRCMSVITIWFVYRLS